MPILRPYQSNLFLATRASFQQGHRAPLLVSPCGSGKTVLFCSYAQAVVAKKKRVMILAHRDELLDQISDTLTAFGVSHSFVAAGRPFNPRSLVLVASVFTLARRLKLIPPPDMIIIDESHHAIRGSTWSKILDAFPKAHRIGVTASPQRLSGEPLSDMFDDLILGPSVSELMALGALSPYRLFVPGGIQTEGLHRVAGDFNKGELNLAADKPSITGDAITHYERHAKGKRAVAFCCSIEHAKHVASQFNAAGYASCTLDGTMDRQLRRQTVEDFRAGKITVLTSVDVVSEGFDLPSIEVAIMLRPTQSLALWIQQSGRALRPSPGKEHAIILDHAGNAARHGLPDDERFWSLEGAVKAERDDDGEVKIKIRTCPKCQAALSPLATSCKWCGHVFEVQSREVVQKKGDLVELKRDEALEAEIKALGNVDANTVLRQMAGREKEVEPIRLAAIKALAYRQRARQQGKAQTYEDLVALGHKRNMKSPEGWAAHVMAARAEKNLATR